MGVLKLINHFIRYRSIIAGIVSPSWFFKRQLALFHKWKANCGVQLPTGTRNAIVKCAAGRRITLPAGGSNSLFNRIRFNGDPGRSARGFLKANS